ncbi:MAG: hypothetical protein WB821_03125 [Burkholderiaceae bacterium]
MTHTSMALKLGATLILASAAWAAQAQPNVNVSVDGVIRPGVYGRVVIGTGYPPPQVIYPQPVIITQPAVVVQQSPIYMNVPYGHSKNWAKHCHKYSACNQPVYFVQASGRRGEHGRGRDHDDDRRGKHGGKHRHGD